MGKNQEQILLLLLGGCVGGYLFYQMGRASAFQEAQSSSPLAKAKEAIDSKLKDFQNQSAAQGF